MVLIEQGELDEALARLRKALEMDPDNAFAHVNLGVILGKRGQIDAAIQEFETAIRINPEDGEARFNMGRALLAKGNLEEAIAHFQAAVALNPNDASRQFEFGNVLFRKGSFADAITAYEQSLEINPGFVEARLALASALASNREYAKSAAHFEQASQSAAAGDYQAVNNLAWLLATCPERQVRNGEKAVRLMEGACQLTGFRDPTLLNTLAAGYAEQGRWDEATVTATNALRLLRNANDPLAQEIQAHLEAYRQKRPIRAE